MTTGASAVPAVSITSMFGFMTPSTASGFIGFWAWANLGSSVMFGIFENFDFAATASMSLMQVGYETYLSTNLTELV